MRNLENECGQRGIAHSEFNASDEQPAHLLQIWIVPEIPGVEPAYERKSFVDFKVKNGLTLLASKGGAGDSVHINQDVNIFTGNLHKNRNLDIPVSESRHCWVQLISGNLEIEGLIVDKGDGVTIGNRAIINIHAKHNSEFLLFDLK